MNPAELTPESLRQLAAAIEGQDPEGKARRELTPEAAGDLANMLHRGLRPTVGWWRRHSTRPKVAVLIASPSAEVIALTAVGMLEDGWEVEVVAEAVATAAIDGGLGREDAIAATAEGVRQWRWRRAG